MSLQLTRGAWAEPGSSLNFKTGSWRSERPEHQHWAAPCHSHCPAGEDAQAWIARIQEGHLREAWEIIVRVNPLPAITGRVCPHPCESGCNRQFLDESVNIHGLERWLGDQALEKGWSLPKEDLTGEGGGHFAIVGAGPAGLSCAWQLRRRGHDVTLYDALPEPGGLLRTALPLNRLPRPVLDAEIKRILDLGVNFQGRARIGDSVQLSDLRRDYDAVFLAPGTEKARAWSVDGAVPYDHRTALDLLKEWIDIGNVPKPRSIAIHGGGNTAVDLCRVLKRAGVEEVHLITASGLPGPDTEPDDILNIVPRELEQALEEGVVIHPHRTVQRLIMRGTRLIGAEMVRLRKLPGASGRKQRVTFEGTEVMLHVDMMVPAIGEVVNPSGFERVMGGDSYLRPADESGQLPGHRGLYAGGDARGDRGTVSAAIGDGRKAAMAMEAALKGGKADDSDRPEIAYASLNTAYYKPAAREREPITPVAERTDTDEIEGMLPLHSALAEAGRCFSCGNCLACDNCWTYCPDNAVLKTAETATDGSHYVFDYEYCKGCGLCARECPCGYIVMRPEA